MTVPPVHAMTINHTFFFTRMALRLDLTPGQLFGVHTVYWRYGSVIRAARNARRYQRGDYRRTL